MEPIGSSVTKLKRLVGCTRISHSKYKIEKIGMYLQLAKSPNIHYLILPCLLDMMMRKEYEIVEEKIKSLGPAKRLQIHPSANIGIMYSSTFVI